MSEQINERELIAHIAAETDADENLIKLVLKHEQAYINGAKEDKNGEVEIDSDELVDYILGRPDVKASELTVEAILDAEMDYLMDKGVAGYVD
ncbi:hypothetical protein [Paenibacillus arenilitoris]|uniref:Uncharacterized protein n=1 Tax=Paenibacillus arenilitoris TaxID=2772299 RepID=A0A927CN42_9BACL|nr:hypothetical protein [Paenibacillus arenilitoris]MBD2869196.1 hypothetical protein [Paenibacillus arenilitoris]